MYIIVTLIAICVFEDRKRNSFISVPEPEHKIEELRSEERLKRI